jgi:F0F1-type ATP synthase alpha subunit
VLASINRTKAQLAQLASRLEAAGALGHTAIVAAEPDAPLGKKYATMCSAYAIGGAQHYWTLPCVVLACVRVCLFVCFGVVG